MRPPLAPPLLLLALLSTALACERSSNVGSACAGGICETGAAFDGLQCLVSETRVVFQLTSWQDMPGVLPDGGIGLIPFPEAFDADQLCFPIAPPRSANGLVECTMLWMLPEGAGACADLRGTRSAGDAVDGMGPGRCVVNQLAIFDESLTDGSGSGWYLDDFSDQATACGGSAVRFSPTTRIQAGTTIELHCTTALSDAAPRADAGLGTGVRSEECARPLSTAVNLGRACEPSMVPPGGFDAVQAYLSVGTPDCASGACLVYGVQGNPLPSCDSRTETCAPPQQSGERSYCSCRCDVGDDPEARPCSCGRGFSCIEIMEDGPRSIRGGYCVRDGTVDG
jgi:hypothetical protein